MNHEDIIIELINDEEKNDRFDKIENLLNELFSQIKKYEKIIEELKKENEFLVTKLQKRLEEN